MAGKRKSPKYTPEQKARLIEVVLEELATHGNGSRACRAAGVPRSTFELWCAEDPELAGRYARARAIGLDEAADEMEAIAADESIPPETRRLMVDVRKWLLARLARAKYGDRLGLEGADGGPIRLEGTAADVLRAVYGDGDRDG